MKRYISCLLVLVLLITLVPLSALADNDMHASEQIKAYIKSKEGCALKAYINPGETNYTIGYGHCAPDIYPGMTITKAQADAYFEQDIAIYEEYVNRISKKYENSYGKPLTQNEFDAIFSLTYNFGTSWIEYKSWRLAKYMREDFHKINELELVDSMGCLCNAGTVIYEGLILRRFDEAKILLRNDYSGNSSPDFVYVVFKDIPSGLNTKFANDARNGNRVAVYYKNAVYGELPTLDNYNGKYFAGWETENGNVITKSTVASANIRVKPIWSDTKPNDPPASKCQYGANCPSKNFTDVPSTFWAHAEIDNAVNMDLFKGTSTTAFSPNMEMNRGMLVTVLYRLANTPSVAGLKNEFPDVVKNSYYDAILWAHANNIAHGFSDGTFRPNDPITREQFATFLQRFAANIYKMDTESANYADLSKFKDSAEVDQAYRESMSWAVGEGIINGTSATTLSPNDCATRAQVAVILTRFTANT